MSKTTTPCHIPTVPLIDGVKEVFLLASLVTLVVYLS